MKKILLILGILLIFSTKANSADFPYDSIFNLKLGMTRDEVKIHLDSLKIKWEERKNDEGGKDISVDFVLEKQKRKATIYENQVQGITLHFANKQITSIYISLEFNKRRLLEEKLEETSNCYFVTDKKLDKFLYLFDSCDIEYYCKLHSVEILPKDEKFKCKE